MLNLLFLYKTVKIYKKSKLKFSKYGKISKNNPREQKSRGVKKYYDSLNGDKRVQVALRLFHVFIGWIENQERKAVFSFFVEFNFGRSCCRR